MRTRNVRTQIARLGLLGLFLLGAGAAPAIEVVQRPRPALPMMKGDQCWMPWKGQLAYGRAIMTLDDRREFRALLNASGDCREKQERWLSHVEAMQRRALALGVSIPEPPAIPRTRRPGGVEIYARHLMTVEERNEFQRQFALLQSEEERWAFGAAHVERMQERASRWSMTLRPPLTEAQEESLEAAAERAWEARQWTEVISTIRANQEDPDRKKPKTTNLLSR